jgi:hypothetical protein
VSFPRNELIAEHSQVVRLWWLCRITRAAATIRPMVCGQRLTLRRALNVIFSSELPRSPTARIPLWALL